MGKDLSDLEIVLGHQFVRRSLLEEALTHSSLDPSHRPHVRDYDRLEFLGDRVLGVLIATELWRRFPNAKAGELALRYNASVRQEQLAEIAQALGVKDWLYMAKSERANGGSDKPAVLADVIEAIIGAIYVDGGLAIAEQFVLKHFSAALSSEQSSRKDAKTALQEAAHAKGLGQPTYHVVSQTGPAHEPLFSIQVSVTGGGSSVAEGRSKREAEQLAASRLLEELEQKR